jgi:membrane fusion protein (multidrug efflux system)
MSVSARIVKSGAMMKTDAYDLAALEDGETEILTADAGAQPSNAPHAKTPQRQAGARASDEAQSPQQTARKAPRKRFLVAAALIAALGIGGYYGHYWLTEGRYLVSTDDAYVRADSSVISAKVSGLIAAVPVTDNFSVRAGDVLVQIDDRDYKIAVDSARNKIATQEATIERLKRQAAAQGAVIEQAKAQVASAKAGLVRASADFERAQDLAQKEFGSKQKLDQARADRDQGQASVKAAEAAQASAEANLSVLIAQVREAENVRAELQSSLDKALLDLSFTTVRAPFASVVGNKVVQPGQYVQPGTRMLSLVPLGTAYVEANYKETQLDGIRPGQPAEVAVDAAGGRVYRGVVESIAPASGSQYSLLPPENATGNFTKIVQRVPVRIRVEGEAIRQGVLRPGLSVVTSVNTKGGAQLGGAAAAQTDK